MLEGFGESVSKHVISTLKLLLGVIWYHKPPVFRLARGHTPISLFYINAELINAKQTIYILIFEFLTIKN
jgi:hypothetical protein